MVQLTVYKYKASPFSERVELALNEAKIPYKSFEIDLSNKPAFFTEKVNPVGEVPAITYGGPDVAPDEPSELSVKLAESNVILEFIADAYPESKLMPTDPVQRAKVRFFMEAVGSKLFPALSSWFRYLQPDSTENLLKAIESIQELISESAQYAIGDSYTIADACITPLVRRLQLSTEYDIGKFPAGDGFKFGETLKGPRFAKFSAYVDAVTNRPTCKEIFDLESNKEVWIRIFGRE